MPSYTLAQMKHRLTENEIKIGGVCPTCDQAQWQAITYEKDDDKEYRNSLPAAYAGTIREGDERIYLACFCPMFHKFINYWPMFCDGNIPGETESLKNYIENKG